MKVYSLANQKGGAGKSTVAVNLAAGIGEAGRSVLVLDADPQASTSDWFGVDENGKALFNSLANEEPLQDAITPTDTEGVDLVPGGEWLVKAGRELAGEPGAETILKNRLQELPDRWEFALIDTPPNLEVMTVSSLTASDGVLVPVEASYMAAKGLARLQKTINMVQDRLNPALEIRGVLPNRVDQRLNHSGDVMDKLKETYDGKVYEPGIRVNVRLTEAPSHSEPIQSYAPNSRGSEDFRTLTTQFLERETEAENE